MELSRAVSIVAIVSALCTRSPNDHVPQTDAELVKSTHVPVQYDVIVDYGLHMCPRFRVSRWCAEEAGSKRP